MTKMHRIEDAARLAMAGFPDLDTPQLRPKPAPRTGFHWLGAALALACAATALWLVI